MPPSDPILPEAPSHLSIGAVSLRFSHVAAGDAERGLVPFYHYRVFIEEAEAGHINLRVGDTEHVRLYAGHIGYEVFEAFRGRGYAVEACRALAPFVRLISPEVIITADSNNYASLRTIERLGAIFLNEVLVPPHDPHYAQGSRIKRRYLWTP